MSRSRIVSLLSVLPTPLLVLGSAHELYLRNQQELDGVSGVLVPFWGGAGVAVALGLALVALAHRAWARTALCRPDTVNGVSPRSRSPHAAIRRGS